MALTQERRQELLDYLSTSRNETMTANLSYGPEQRAYLELADMTEAERKAVCGFEYKCYVFRAKNRTENCPVHINIHGGGFYYGHKENDAMYSAYIADKIRGIVVDIDYKTSADGAAWPVPMEQCYDAAKWVFASCAQWGADEKRVSIGGYSAGSTLSAAVALKAGVTKEFRFCLAVLGYGVTDSVTEPQYKLHGYLSHMMPVRRMNAFTELLTDGDKALAADPYLSPLYAPDEMLAAMPRTLVISAGECDLRFEDERLGARLTALGVEVTMRRFIGARHGFIPHFMAYWQEGTQLIIEMLNSASL
ncbi:MAG: alpha/beta hydrolase fold domain-containing protein [Candidatus Heteroscillospira sp.]|jgi:acetyl esterase